MEEHINLFYAIKPLYIFQKFFGIFPFSVDFKNSQDIFQNSRWNMFYTTFIVVLIIIVNTSNYWFDDIPLEELIFKINEIFTRSFILISAVITLSLNLIRGREIFNRVIKKIVLVDEQIWQQELPTIYRATRVLVIKVMLIYIFVELGFILLEWILFGFGNGFSNLEYISYIINTSTIMQITLLTWLLIQRFNQIGKILEEYNPETKLKTKLQNQITSFATENNSKR